MLQGVEFLRNVLICGRLCLPKRMAEEGRPDAAGLQVRKLGNLAAESGGTCEDHGRLFLLEPAAVLAFEKLFAPKAAEGEESLEVGGAVLLLVHAEGELPCEGLGTLDTPEVRAEERIVEDALGDEGEAHAVDDHADDRLEAVDVRDDVVLGEVKADLGVEEDAGARALLSKNPALARELLPGRDALCETVTLGRHHDHFVGNPRLGDEVRICDGALDDRDVGREVEERFGHLGGVGDAHFGHPARVRLKVAHQVREHEGADRERTSAVNRYASAGLTGNFGALNTVLAYEFQNYDSVGDNGREKDGHIVYLGGNYDCGFAKTFVMGQYFKGIKLSSVTALGMLDDYDVNEDDTLLDVADAAYNEGAKGYGLHIGTIVPISNGDLTVGAYYVDGTGETSKANVEERDFDYMGLATKYEYRLSKRTSVYLGAGFYKATIDATRRWQ